MQRLELDDQLHLEKKGHKFFKDLVELQKKHQLDHLGLNMRFFTAGDPECPRVWVNDGRGHHCWKCVGDHTPCP